jgi:hypothetical protein
VLERVPDCIFLSCKEQRENAMRMSITMVRGYAEAMR